MDCLAHIRAVTGDVLATEVMKADIPPAATYDPTWIGPTASMLPFSSAFLELTRPLTVVDRGLASAECR